MIQTQCPPPVCVSESPALRAQNNAKRNTAVGLGIAGGVLAVLAFSVALILRRRKNKK